MEVNAFKFDYLFEMLEKIGKKMQKMYFDLLEENVKLKKENEKLRSFRKWALEKGTLII